MPFFSVVIPLYNKEKYIRNTLHSVLSQNFRDFEIIIVNDGSTDRSGEIVMGFSDSRIRYFSKGNEGVSAARNFGIAKAQSDYIAFIDADDFWHPGFLQIIHQNIELFPNNRVFSTAIEIETPDALFPAKYSVKAEADTIPLDFFSASLKECIIWTSAAVFHKEVFQKAGVFDINLKSGEDVDLWIRIGLQYQIIFTKQILARYVYDEHSLSKNPRYGQGMLDFSKFHKTEKTNPALKKYLDLNRYSLAIKAKLSNDHVLFSQLKNQIDANNLPGKKRLLLMMPGEILKKMIWLQYQLAKRGLADSVFK